MMGGVEGLQENREGRWQEGREAVRLTRMTQTLADLLRSSPTPANHSMMIPPPTSHVVKSTIAMNCLPLFPSSSFPWASQANCKARNPLGSSPALNIKKY